MPKASSKVMKRAWVRDPDVPPGRPALGRIKCPCAGTPESSFGDGKDVVCACGIVYDSRGYVKADLREDADFQVKHSPTIEAALESVCPDGGGCSDAKCRRLRHLIRWMWAGK